MGNRASISLTYPFEDLTYTAGANLQPITFKSLPPTFGGYYCHLRKLVLDVAYTPTFAMGNEPTVRGGNHVIANLEITDGEQVRLQGDGGLNLIRLRERITTGRTRLPDEDTDTATATARYFRRVWHAGPTHTAGSTGDWVIPVGMLTNGRLSGTYGTLAQVGTGAAGNPTNVTATIRVTAFLDLLDHINIPPVYAFQTYSATGSDFQLGGAGGRRLESLCMLDGATYPNIGAGDFGVVRLDVGMGGDLTNVQGETLTASYMDDFATGHTPGAFTGEPEAASDDNHKIVNGGTPTALTGGPNDVQMIYWTPPGGRISKMLPVRNALRLRWNGTQTTAVVGVGSILPRTPEMLAQHMIRAGVNPATARLKAGTLSKRDPAAELKPYIPVKVRP